MKVYLPVSLCNSRSGVAYRICGNLQELNVRENRISISSVNNRGSVFTFVWRATPGSAINTFGKIFINSQKKNEQNRFVDLVLPLVSRSVTGDSIVCKWMLSMHWDISLIHAPLSCTVGATK